MTEPPVAAPQPCCVCAAPNGKHCTKCKSRHYCSKACQLVDWQRGHKAQCKHLAAEFQDRLLDELMPAKLKIKEEPAIVEEVSPADGANPAARLSAVRAAKKVDVIARSDDTPSWRGTCAICLDRLPFGDDKTFYSCCCKMICTVCHVKCRQHDLRCPLCRAPPPTSASEAVRRLQKHVDKGNAEAQAVLGTKYRDGNLGLQQNFKRAVQLFELAAAQGNAIAQKDLGLCYAQGQGVEIDDKTAARWFRHAAEQGLPTAQWSLGIQLFLGRGVAQSHDEAAKWYRLAAAQGHADAIFNLGACHAHGLGVPQDDHEALRLFKRAAAKGHADAAQVVDMLLADLAAAHAA